MSELMEQSITLLFGTSNTGKMQAMRKHISSLNIRLLSLHDIDAALPDIDESGTNPLDNARIKALAYYNAARMPVFSCDSGLFIKGAPLEMQPGVHVRTINGTYLSDEEMIIYYSELAKNMGGQMTVQYRNGICLVMNENEIYEYTGDDIAGEEFIITSIPHTRRTSGFPLDSLSIHIGSGKYYYDLDKFKNRSSMDDGFQNFFKRVFEK